MAGQIFGKPPGDRLETKTYPKSRLKVVLWMWLLQCSLYLWLIVCLTIHLTAFICLECFFMQAHIYSVVFESKGIGADSSKKTTLDKNRKKNPK